MEILKNLCHTNIIKLINYLSTSQSEQLILEYAGSYNLYDYIVARNPSIRVIATIFGQVCEAVSYLHLMNIAHRDLKLENIVIDDGNNTNSMARGNQQQSVPPAIKVKLIDFGFAVRCQPGQLLADRCGTPAYMSPEVVKKERHEGPPVDVWALGVLLFRMVYKCLPFISTDCTDLYNRIVSDPPGFPRSMDSKSALLQGLISSMLEKDPKLRPTITSVDYLLTQIMNHPWLISNSLLSTANSLEID